MTKRYLPFLPLLLIVLFVGTLEVVLTARAVQSHSTTHQVCMLPSVENGYTESYPVHCVNTDQVATQQDIAAGVYAPPAGLDQYLHWYATDAVLIHHGSPCFILRSMGMNHCAGSFLQPTAGQLYDWQDYQAYLGGACEYREPDQPACDDPN